MIKILPFVLIPVLILGGLWYWRSVSSKPVPVESGVSVEQDAVEVPKTLPEGTSVPAPTPARAPTTQIVTPDPRVAVLETAVTDLKARVSTLEKATPVPVSVVSSGKSTVYIPLGSGGSTGDKTWISNDNYGATIDPAEYPGYTSMQLEVNFRMTQKSGTAYARFYNVTDQTYKEQVSTTSDAFSWQTSFGFTLPSGKKTYTLQTKSSEGAEIQLQSARIKVNF